MMRTIICAVVIWLAALTQAQTQKVYQVAYLSHFTNDTLASEGLETSAGVNGYWALDTTNNLLTGTRTSTNPQGNVYTSNSWQNDAGFTLYVTFNQQIAGARYSFGLVTSNYTISEAWDSFNLDLAGAYGIGVTLCGEKGDALVFNNGTTSSVLSTAQGANSPGTLETMYITVTSNSYSYSLNGAPATTGSMTFDASKSFRFVAHAQDVDNQYIKSITLTKIPANPVTPAELQASLTNQLAKFPFTWDKIGRWSYARKNTANWTDAEIALMCKGSGYVWIQEPPDECARFRAAYPTNKMFCFNAYLNLEKAYIVPNPMISDYFLYNSAGNPVYYLPSYPRYNQTNPDERAWWVDTIAGYATNGVKSDVIFIDSLQKALNVASGDYYDYWGNPISDNYMETGFKPLFADMHARLATNFILQGNFLRASPPTYTTDGNVSYISNYVHSSYVELFEEYGPTYAQYLHKGMEAFQNAVRLGKMMGPNVDITKPTVCPTMTLADMRTKASAAMPAFWARLDSTNQDALATMYAYFDFKLAYFLIMAGERSYLRYQSSPVGGNAGGLDQFKLMPPFPEFNAKLGAPLYEGYKTNSTTWVREFKNCKVTLNVEGGQATLDWRFRAYWPLDEGSGTNAVDASGYGRDGTITSGTWVTGIKSNALSFNGSSSTVTLPASAFSSISDQVSIAVWTYGGSTLPKASTVLYAQDASGKRVFNIHLPWSNGTVFWDAGNSTGYDRISKAATASQYKNAWNHWVFTKNATTGVMNIYLNGTLWHTATGKVKTVGTITTATLGSQLGTSNFYHGVLDDVKVFNRALSSDEVYDVYMDLQ
jgi:hypothetical protein